MKYKIQEGCEVSRTLDERISIKQEETSIHTEFFDRFKTWEQIRAERYNC